MPKIRLNEPASRLDRPTSDFDAYPATGVIAADASGVGVSPLIVSLPPAPTSRSIEITVVNVGASGTVVVDADGSETIEGALTYNLAAQWDAVTLVSVGGGWAIGGGGGGGGEVYNDTVPNLGVSTFQGAVESLVVGAPSTSFIFNSSGIQGGTRYNDWADLMTALSNTRYGGPRNILFEQNETIPVGTYDLTNVTLLGNGIGVLGGGITVTLQTGTTITSDILRASGGLCVNWAGTGTLMNGTGSFTGVKAIYLSDEASVLATGGGAFIRVDPGAEARLVALSGQTCIFAGNGAFSGFANGHLVELDTAANAVPVVFIDNAGGTVWTDDMVEVLSALNQGSASFFLYSPTVAPLGIDPRAQTWDGPGTLVTVSTVVASDASRESYTPALLADWSGVAPASIADALDRIAAVLTPIP